MSPTLGLRDTYLLSEVELYVFSKSYASRSFCGLDKSQARANYPGTPFLRCGRLGWHCG